MLRNIPALLLILTAFLIGAFFFRVVQPFILPLVLAGVSAVLVWPVQKWMTKLCRGHSRIAAIITTVLVVLVVLLPLIGGVAIAATQLTDIASSWMENEEIEEVLPAVIADPQVANQITDSATEPWFRQLPSWLSRQQFERLQEMIANGIQDATTKVYEQTVAMVANTVGFVLGTGVFLLALYYFLAENSGLLVSVQRLSPLDNADDQAIWETFVQACRGMLLGTILAAALQAVLNGLGFAVAGIQGALLLAFCTFVVSVIPYLGAASVWIPVAIYLAFQERWLAACLLAVYGAVIVSSVDNLIRAYAIHDQAHIHPLVALVAILGAVRLLGLWGIIVGPVTAVLFHVLLELVSKRLEQARSRSSARAADYLTNPPEFNEI